MSLETTDLDAARRAKPIKEMEFFRRVDRIRDDLTANKPRELTEQEAYLLVQRWFVEAKPMYGVNPDGSEMDSASQGGLVEQTKESLETLQRLLGRRNYGPVRSIADRLLARDGLEVEPGSPVYQKLCATLMRCQIELYRMTLAELQGDFTYQPEDPAFSEVAKRRTDEKTIGHLIDAYEAEKAGAWSPKTQFKYANVYRVLRDMLGNSRPLSTVTREDCRKIRNVLADLPPNFSKLNALKGLPIDKAAAEARRLDLNRIAPRTLNDYMNSLSALFRFAKLEQWIDSNPAQALSAPDPVRAGAKRLPFEIDELNAIFSAPLYTGCKDDGPGYATPGPNRPRRGRFWVPLLALFHGLRLNEACQLLVDDVREMSGIHCIIIEADPEGGDEEDQKRVKTDAGKRFVPVHPEVLELGFLSYVEEMRAGHERRLFPELPIGKSGYYSDVFSKFFSRFLQKVGVKTAKNGFHSLRHNYRDALREADVSLERVRALGGWASSGGTESDYGKGLSPKALQEAIEKVRYVGLDLSHLCCL